MRASGYNARVRSFIGRAAPLDSLGMANALRIVDGEAMRMWAVLGVETSGCGFRPDRRPKILFERHVFSRLRRRRPVRSSPPPRESQLTRPYQTLLVQIFFSLTTSPVFGACQIFPFPA